MRYVQPKFTPDGQLITDVMLGTYDSYPVGSRLWAEALAMHVQHDHERMMRDGNPRHLCKVITDALTAEPPPWEIYPEEAKGNPESWIRMVTLASWDEVREAVEGRAPGAWREIGDHLAQWEAEHRKPGAPEGNQNAAASCGETTGGDTPDCSEPRDHKSARGIRRRLVM